ncbi:MAG: alpha-L-arabinofuranosidase C-terminal domain-containing protein, partial [Blastocatellia bacterium]
HHYSWNVSGGRTTNWIEGKGQGVNYPNEEWYELLSEANVMEKLITDNWAIMGEFDRQHRVKLVVDEWGAWYKPGSEVHNTHLLGQQSTIRDAVLAGLTLDIFHRHADKVAMANVAQLINCLQALFLAHEDKFITTPTYHVFDMYSAHQGGQSLRTNFSSPRTQFTRAGKTVYMPGLNGSASLKDKQLTLTVTNPNMTAAVQSEISVHGATVKDVTVTTLTAKDIHAHNNFENPRAIEPQSAQAVIKSGSVSFNFAPASVTKLQLNLN